MCTIRSSTCTIRYSAVLSALLPVQSDTQCVLSDLLPVQSDTLLFSQILYLYSPILYCTIRSSTCTIRYSTVLSDPPPVQSGTPLYSQILYLYSQVPYCTLRSSTCTVWYSTVLSDPLPVLPAGLPVDGGLQDCGRGAAGGGLRQETQTSSGQEKHVTAEQHVVSQSATGGELCLRSLVTSSHQFGNQTKTKQQSEQANIKN